MYITFFNLPNGAVLVMCCPHVMDDDTEALRDLVPGLGPTETVPGSVGLLCPRRCCTVGRGRGSEARQIWVSILVVSLTRHTTLGNLSEH